MELPGEKPEVTVYQSEADGAWVVQIDTPGIPESRGRPRCRVYLNDGDLWLGEPYPHEL